MNIGAQRAPEHDRMTGVHAGQDEKVCRVCGRRFAWRKKWERDWPRVRHCSSSCRRRGLRDIDAALERAIEDLLRERGSGKTICPSEAARRVRAERWRELMEPARMAARRLAEAGRVSIRQGGRVVDPSRARGAIRVGPRDGGRGSR